MEEILVNATAMRLVLETDVGRNPSRASVGVKIIPPPTPRIEPTIPPAIPTTTKIMIEAISIMNASIVRE